ncbi:hypothetical protein [uncultured Bartonella sp.]|uniref:hypothetical protein n=1 Tax=uncultured Bartonella sp. TaxID=104108 RepID=UPI002606F5DF|nr:hypothetical protein [uncultured Bartonella sp.]
MQESIAFAFYIVAQAVNRKITERVFSKVFYSLCSGAHSYHHAGKTHKCFPTAPALNHRTGNQGAEAFFLILDKPDAIYAMSFAAGRLALTKR